MKKTFLGIIIGISLTTLIAAGIDNYQVRKNTAEVEIIEGLYIFTSSKPVNEYNYLGTVKSGITLDGFYPQVISSVIKRAKKSYPTADAIIFDGNTKADVIKFK